MIRDRLLRPWVALVALASIVPVPALGQGPQGVATLGPAPRTEAGRFANPTGPLGHGSVGVRLPFMLRRIAGAFSYALGVETESMARRANALRAGARRCTRKWHR